MPTPFDDTNFIIIGPGSSGLLSVIMLHQRNISCTLLELQRFGYEVDISRTYHFSLNLRVQRCVDAVPALLSILVAILLWLKPYAFVDVNQDRTVNIRTVASAAPGHAPSLLYLRSRLIDGLRLFVKYNCSFVTAAYNTNVFDVGFQRETIYCENKLPVIHCTADVKGEHRTFTTCMLIACDGVHSVVVKSVRSLRTSSA